MLPVNEKVEVLDLIRKKKKLCSYIVKLWAKNESSTGEIQKEKKIQPSTAVRVQAAKVKVMVHKRSGKMEKALSLYINFHHNILL